MEDLDSLLPEVLEPDGEVELEEQESVSSGDSVVNVNIDYTAFEVPDEFVVGYGLDYAQKYRNLPYIGVVEFE